MTAAKKANKIGLAVFFMAFGYERGTLEVVSGGALAWVDRSPDGTTLAASFAEVIPAVARNSVRASGEVKPAREWSLGSSALARHSSPGSFQTRTTYNLLRFVVFVIGRDSDDVRE